METESKKSKWNGLINDVCDHINYVILYFLLTVAVFFIDVVL